MKDGKLAKSPCDGIDPPSPKKSGERVLSDDEIGLVWQAAEKMGPFGFVVQLLILTGQRRGEVAGMERQELDLAKRLWALPPARVKNNKRHTVPLSPQTLAVIERAPRIGDRFVFTTNGNTPASDFGKNKRRLDAMLPANMPPWCLHDLRRTCASGMARLGVSLPVTEKVLNHISGSFSGIVSVYQQHDFADEKRSARIMGRPCRWPHQGRSVNTMLAPPTYPGWLPPTVEDEVERILLSGHGDEALVLRLATDKRMHFLWRELSKHNTQAHPQLSEAWAIMKKVDVELPEDDPDALALFFWCAYTIASLRLSASRVSRADLPRSEYELVAAQLRSSAATLWRRISNIVEI